MRDFSNYRPPSSDILVWSGIKTFEKQLEVDGDDVLVDGVSVRAIILTHTNPYNENKEDRKFLCPLDVNINKGSIVDYDNGKWMVITDVDANNSYKFAKIFECNNTLTFYKNRILYKLPCIISAIGNSLGMSTDENKYVTDISDVIMVRVPDNEISRLIEVNDIFKIGKKNYKITNDSDIIEAGLLIFKMQVTLEEPETHVFTLNITNGETVSVQESSSIQINTDVYDNGLLISPTPALIFTSSNTSICTVSSTGLVTGLLSGTATIIVSLASDNTIQDVISIEVTALPQENYTVDVYGVTTVKLNSTITLNADVLNNGIVDVTKGVTWVITNQDGTSISTNPYVTIVSQTANSITLKATNNSSYVNKYVVVKGVFTEDSMVYDEHILQIRNVF